MARLLVALLVLTPLPILALADGPDPEPPGRGVKQLQGEWDVVSIKTRGREMKLGVGRSYSMAITKDRMIRKLTLNGKTRESTVTYKVDPRKSPAHIDTTLTTTSQTTYGIYKLQGDELTLALGSSTDPNGRPKDFESAVSVMVLKRKKK
jgi:uncharacterized protein (TIGR03067 family)